MPLLSIVIPVYNVEKYLDECLQSILRQDFTDYEVILVDNGSTDASGDICDHYASKHDRIKVIHLEENSLPAGARNVGLTYVEGEYVHFCDSDDCYVDGSFSHIAKILREKSPSVLMGQFICIPEKGAFVTKDVPLDPKAFQNSSSSQMAAYLLSLPEILFTPWRFFVKREFLVSQDLVFTEKYYCEDLEWFVKLICTAETYALLQTPFYCYRPRAAGSITSRKTYFHSKSQLKVAMNLLRFLYEKRFEDSRRDLIFYAVRFLLGLFATRCDTFNREQLRDLAAIVGENMDLVPLFSGRFGDDDLFSFCTQYGPFMGLCLYRTYVIEKTLSLVYGKEDKEIYIFPTGYNGEGTARILRNAGYHVRGFLDNSEFKNESTIDGLPVNLPGILKHMPKEKRDNIFVMVTTQRENVARTIMDQLKGLGIDESQFAGRIY